MRVISQVEDLSVRISSAEGAVMRPEAGFLMEIMGVVTVAVRWDFSNARSASSISQLIKVRFFA